MREVQNVIPITKAKSNFLDIIRKIEETDETVAITKNGVPISVIMNIDRFDGLLETIDILGDPGIMKLLVRSQKQFKGKKTVSHDVAWKR